MSPESAGAILIEVRTTERILVAKLNRPEVGNAIDGSLAQALGELAGRIEMSRDIDAVVIAASGRVFCGGGDVALFSTLVNDADHPAALPQMLDKLSATVHAALLRLVQAGPLLVAAVNGPATGAGLGLICACDTAFARPNATLRAGFAHLGLSPDTGTSYFLPRIVGYRTALEILLGGEPVTAERALALGIYQQLLAGPEDNFLDEVLARTKALIRSGPAVRDTLALLRASQHHSLGEHLAQERDRLVALADRPEVLAHIRGLLKCRS